jgi:iron(III) transport system ATP-binding protein
MNTGHIAQVGTARELYDQPATRFVAEFIGRMNILKLDEGRFAGRAVELPGQHRDAKLIGIRPEDVRVHAGIAVPDGGCFQASLRNVVYLGNLAHLVLDIEGAQGEVVAEVAGHALHDLTAAGQVAVGFPRESIKVLG